MQRRLIALEAAVPGRLLRGASEGVRRSLLEVVSAVRRRLLRGASVGAGQSLFELPSAARRRPLRGASVGAWRSLIALASAVRWRPLRGASVGAWQSLFELPSAARRRPLRGASVGVRLSLFELASAALRRLLLGGQFGARRGVFGLALLAAAPRRLLRGASVGAGQSLFELASAVRRRLLRGTSVGAGQSLFELASAARRRLLRGASVGARRSLIALAAVACGGDLWIERVDPAEGLALGGDRVAVLGSGFGDGLRVTFGGVPSPSVDVGDDGSALATLPRGLAGLVEVGVSFDDSDADTLPDGFRYLPIELGFLDPGPGWTPPSGPLIDGWAGDLDGDGLDDVLVLGADYALRWWRNTGAGSLVDAGLLVDEPVMAAAIADLDGDGRLDVAVCPRDATAPRLLLGDPGGRPLAVPTALPPIPGGCDALALGSAGEIGVLRREGSGSVVELLEPDGSGGWVRRGASVAGPCPVSGALACEVVARPSGGFVATLSSSGSGELRVPLTLGRLPTAFEVRVVGGDLPLAALIVDDAGQRFTAPIEGGAGVRVVRAPETWAGDGEGELMLPIRAAGLLVEGGESEAQAEVADLRLHLSGGGRVLLTDFAGHTPPITLERRHHRLALADVDGDGSLDALVGDSASGGALAGFAGRGASMVPIPASRLDPLGCGVRDVAPAALVGQGGADLVVACRDGQDRLLVNDGSGRFFDDTARTLPLGRGDSARLTLADLDLDGVPELLIAKRDGVDRLYGSYGARWLDRTARLGLEVADTRRMLAVDVDADGDLDLVGLGGAGGWLRVAVPDGARRDGGE